MSLVRLLFNKNKCIQELGRWSTTKNNKSIIKTIDFANHDHCGGELCKNPIPTEKKKKTYKDDDYYIPFCM